MNSRTLKFFGIAAALVALALFAVKFSGESISSGPVSSARSHKSVRVDSAGDSLPSRNLSQQATSFKSDPSTGHPPYGPPLPQTAFNFSIAGDQKLQSPAHRPSLSAGSDSPDEPSATGSVVSVNPSAGGNFFAASGKTVQVSSIERTPEGDSLHVLISDTGNSGPVASDTSSSSQPIRKGFTYEQELFRTKWGWAAFNQVQGTVAEDSITNP